MSANMQMRLGLGVVLGLLCAMLGWLMVRPVHAVEIEQVTWQDTVVTVVRVDLRRADFRLFWQDSQQRLYRRFDALRTDLERQGLHLRFAMNAGMYHADRTPVGLLVQDGQRKSPLNTAEGHGNFFLKPNGVFAVNQAGQAVIEVTEQFAQRDLADIRWATQSGPMLLIKGQIHPIFRPQSRSQKIRNAVGQVDADHVVFVISEQPISFYSLAQLMKEKLRCTDALYLDGSISALYDAFDPDDHQPEDYGVMLGVVESSNSP